MLNMFSRINPVYVVLIALFMSVFSSPVLAGAAISLASSMMLGRIARKIILGDTFPIMSSHAVIFKFAAKNTALGAPIFGLIVGTNNHLTGGVSAPTEFLLLLAAGYGFVLFLYDDMDRKFESRLEGAQ